MRILLALLLGLSAQILGLGASVSTASPSQGVVSAEDPEGRLIQSITVRGNLQNSTTEILETFGVELGAPYVDREVERGLENLFRRFRVLARVEYRAVAGSAEQIELLLTIEKELSRDLEPRFIGNIEIDDEVIEYVARNRRTSVRQLEGALIKLLAFSSLTRREITLDMARDALGPEQAALEEAEVLGYENEAEIAELRRLLEGE